MRKLTDRQNAIIEFIREWQHEHSYPPTIREVADHFKINVPSAAQHLKALEHKGILHREPGRSRSLRLSHGHSESEIFASINEERQPFGQRSQTTEGKWLMPLVARIAAGVPQLAEDVPDESLEISSDWFGRGHLVAVKIHGDSMSGDAIRDGDIGIIKLQSQARSTDIVAVRVDGCDVTLKRVREHNGFVELIPSNPDFPVRQVPAEQVEIIGTLEGIIRRRGRGGDGDRP